MRRRICILSSLLWLLASAAGTRAADRFLVVRYDDYAPIKYTSALESDSSPHATTDSARATQPDFEARLFALFHQYQARLVVGVIPFPIRNPSDPSRPPTTAQPSDSWLADPADPWVVLLRRAIADGTVEPALHGYEHRRRSPSGFRPGEFARQPADWQQEAIRQGRDALAGALGQQVRVFVPPWNSWDASTARALDALNFTWCSSDLHHADYTAGNVRFLPQTAGHPDILLALLHSSQALPPGSVLVLTTHPFDFVGQAGQQYLRSLEQLLQTVQADSDWACIGQEDLPAAPLSQWHDRFARAVAWHDTCELAQDLYGLSAAAPLASPVYGPVDAYSHRIWLWRLAIAAVLLTSATVAWLAGRFTSRRLLRSGLIISVLAGLAALSLVILVSGAMSIHSHGYHVRAVRWQAIAVTGGLVLGLGSARRRPARRLADTNQPTAACVQEDRSS